MLIESGSYCLKYRDFINDEIVKKCEEMPQKGCAGNGCRYLISATKKDDKLLCPLEGTNRDLDDCPYWKEPEHDPALLCGWQDLDGFCSYEEFQKLLRR